MSSSTGSVAVIMTAYNAESWIPDALASLRAQTLQTFRICVVDDGSSDATADIVRSSARRDPRIRLVQTNHIGRGPALNLALQHVSNADYIANLDADDLAKPARLERQLRFLAERPDVGLVGTFALLDHGTHSVELRRPTRPAVIRRRLLRHYPFVHSSVTYRNEALRFVGGFSNQISCCLDYDIACRIALRYRLANIPEFLCVHRKYNPTTFKSLRREDYLAVARSIQRRYAREAPLTFLDRAAGAIETAVIRLRDSWRRTSS